MPYPCPAAASAIVRIASDLRRCGGHGSPSQGGSAGSNPVGGTNQWALFSANAESSPTCCCSSPRGVASATSPVPHACQKTLSVSPPSSWTDTLYEGGPVLAPGCYLHFAKGLILDAPSSLEAPVSTVTLDLPSARRREAGALPTLTDGVPMTGDSSPDDGLTHEEAAILRHRCWCEHARLWCGGGLARGTRSRTGRTPTPVIALLVRHVRTLRHRGSESVARVASRRTIVGPPRRSARGSRRPPRVRPGWWSRGHLQPRQR